MSFSEDVLRSDERAIYNLRELYRKFGYSGYKVGKFEEYDLYARNKSFLISENILTFTDTDGKLMALKPDVTLSIVKNLTFGEKTLNKLYYNENVYRTSAQSNGFREIMQTGLECIGCVDIFSECEVIMLAAKSLEGISEDYMLDVSHMGVLEGLLESEDVDMETVDTVLSCVKSKNTDMLTALMQRGSISTGLGELLCTLTQTYERLSDAVSRLEKLAVNQKMADACRELLTVSKTMEAYGLSDRLYFDFSVVNDFNYYDGVIFKGFINGIPESVLSGGRYDRLLHKMGKDCGAVGFAVYLDRLERFEAEENAFDVDVLLIYGADTAAERVIAEVRRLNLEGKTVRTARYDDRSVRYGQKLKLGNGGTDILETND